MNSLKILVAALTCLFLLFGSVNAAIVINEVELNPPSSTDTDEWIELYNTDGSDSVDISGYIINDSGGSVDAIPDGTLIPANGYFVFAEDSSASLTFSFDSTDTLTLKDGAGQLLDITPVLTDTANNLSTWQRIPDASDSWDFLEETKGESNDGTGGEIPEFPTFILPVLLMLASLSLARKHMPQGL